MVRTYDEEKDKGDGDPPDGGEWNTVSPRKFGGEFLEEKFDRLETILATERPGTDPPEVPDDIESGLGAIDFDFSDLNQRDMLAVVARSNLAILETMFDMVRSVEPDSTIALSGTNLTGDAEEVVKVVQGSGTENVLTRKVIVKASPDNQAPVVIGDDQISPQRGFKLRKGEYISLDINLRQATLWMTSQEPGQEVEVIGFN